MSEVAVTASPDSEKRLAAVLQHRFFLRLHMTAMLVATVLAAIVTLRLLAAARLNVLAIRYALAVAVAYAVFISSVKLWLWYIGLFAAAAARRSTSSGGDWFDSITFDGGGGSSTSGSGSSVSFGGGGGKFGGGGATGSWGDSDSRPSIIPSFLSSKGSGGGSSKGGGGGDNDLGELMLIVLVIVVVVAILAAFVWVIWAAPTILSEIAFNAILAGALTKHAHQASHGSWVGSVVKKTWLPFAGIFLLSVLLGWYAQRYCPDATRLGEAIHCVNPR